MWGDRVDSFSDTQVKGVLVSSSLQSPLWALPDEMVNGLFIVASHHVSELQNFIG